MIRLKSSVFIFEIFSISKLARKGGVLLAGITIFLFVFLVSCSNNRPTPAAEGQADEKVEEVTAAEESQVDSDVEASETIESADGNQSNGEDGDTVTEDSDLNSEESSKAAPTVTPEVEKQVVVCLGGETVSLYPYGDDSIAAVGLRHGIYESLYTSTGYDYQSRGLMKLPSLADGDAELQSVLVNEADRVEDVDGNIVSLVKGVKVVDSAGDVIEFEGTQVEMEQLVVDYTFHPMIWSDGTAVTADDSVFSYILASNPKTTVSKDRVAATESYEATGAQSVRWTGIPGHLDQTYFLNVWEPLPSHQLEDMTIDELRTAEESTKYPLSSGPFVVTDWTSDGDIVLSRNENYYRLDEDAPIIDRIIVRFGNVEEFLAGDQEDACDVISNGAIRSSHMPLLEMAAKKGQWDVLTSPGLVFEQIAFGVNPVIEYAERRPDWFEDTRVRQAITMCTDRERMVVELTDGRAEMLHAYVSENHPLFPGDLQKWEYDPVKANLLLDGAGYLDFAEDGRRQDVSSGIPMTITLGTNSESSLRLDIVEIVQENLAECGIPVETYDFPAGTWYAEGPVGRIFGRRFDLAQFAWIGKSIPDCGLYTTENITGPVDVGFGGWQNTNVTGWSNEAFDNACLAAMYEMPSGSEYDDLQREALRIFAVELPVIPLFTNVKTAAVRPWMKNIQLDPSQPSLLWNIDEWDTE